MHFKTVFVNSNIDNKITLTFKHFQCFLTPSYITLNYGLTDCHQGRCKQDYLNILQAVKSWETTRSLTVYRRQQ